MIPTPNPSPREGRQKPTPLFLTEGRKDTIPTPDPIPERSSPTRSLSPREGSVDGWGKYGLRSSLLAFKTKWRKKGQKQVSPRQRLGDSSQSTFAQNGQKNYYSAHSLCHSLMVGCHSFAPFGGVSLRHPIPRALPGADISMPHSGRNYPPHPLPKGGELIPTPDPSPREGN